MPSLSVVIPAHNTRELTLRCVASLAAAGVPDLQVVVVDDGGTDGTAEALEIAGPHLEILRLSPAAGFTCAANQGLMRARGDVLLLLNSDTEVEPGAFVPLLAAFARNPRLGAAGAVLHYPDGSPQWSGGRAPGLLWLFALASGLPALLARLPRWRRVKPVGAPPGAVEWVTGAALALRRSAWEAVGPMDEGFRFYAQDLDLCLRLRQAGWTVELVPEFRVLHHHGATIGRASGGSGRQNPELLWTDLLRWAGKHRGVAWARRVARALCAGAALRLLGRGLATPLVAAERRAGWREESGAFRRAAAAVKLANPGQAL
ncbi:MAG TPA: glycosyltransferase family 2 protein [Thermoanaerobaculia bacterium]|jgi:GT2 family glycosyltransferase|nr:glycosyltransferase family 2 protein [Thermoanaerobaculia bacterium]